MKKSYLAIAGILGLSTALYLWRSKKSSEIIRSDAARIKKRVTGEKHLRGIMKKSKLAI